MFNIVLFEPEIPPNTGNIMRLCANSGAKLHLIEPLGFKITEKATNHYVSVNFNKDDYFIFGPETRGLPESIRLILGEKNLLRIPMLAESRSINLANSVSIILYEAWRQNNFKNGI